MKKKAVLLTFASVFLSTSLCVLGLLELQIAYASPYTNISVGTAYSMITDGLYLDLVVLDVRTKSEYDFGHIYGAVWIPVSELDERIGELAGHENHEIIVYCKSGGRSVTASGILDSHDFTKVYNMLGGITAWQSAGYPVWIATVHNINTTFNYDTIQAAIDAPQTLDEHTILVDAGTYCESVTLNKSISLVGENKSTTIIDGNGAGDVVHVTANNTVVSNFSIRNSGINNNGILLDNCFGSSVISNNVTGSNWNGILIWHSSNNILRNNTMTNNTCNFGVWSECFQGFINDVDDSNTVNGKPVYYWISTENAEVPLDAGCVVLVDCRNIRIENSTLENNFEGVLLVHTHNSTITRNNVTNNEYGIMLCESSSNNITVNNIATDASGIYLDGSDSNTISGNILRNNEGGLILKFSGGNTLRNNNMTNNRWNFAVSGGSISDFDNDIDTSNLVDEKSVYYIVNQSNLIIDSSTVPDVGYLGIVNSKNVTVKELSLAKNGQGVLFAFANSSTIENVNVSENWVGIQFWESDTSTVSSNMISNNSIGIILDFSDGNAIYHNFINNKLQAGTYESYGNAWDNGYPSGGNFWSDYIDFDLERGPNQDLLGSDGIGDTAYTIDADNQDRYPLMKPYAGLHDIGITIVNISKTVVAEDYNITVTINMTIVNYGEQTETFNFTIQINTTIQEQALTLTSRNSTTITFMWNTTGLAKGNYTIGTVADAVPSEADTIDNAYTGWVVITIPGDVDGSREVNYEDLFSLADGYGSEPSDDNWDPRCDFNNDDKVNYEDLFILADHYGM